MIVFEIKNLIIQKIHTPSQPPVNIRQCSDKKQHLVLLQLSIDQAFDGRIFELIFSFKVQFKSF